ncbi:methionine ABC transporter ATP-binding protein [Ligilactobacillus acidipiscis]|uniref:methionine ABC transporter ATP-binding protein n=1 Tax=Ligilactobacillus acidipiscis TaxID=89059 RepID=UPI0023F872A1|nr:methionine ABC transporter ATP-binding protein [Ligilactobacillus acidipiscis]WEV58126.1 methionine ABC transporter ATP-binding protein [Ligilactobacillus acidipiscis]
MGTTIIELNNIKVYFQTKKELIKAVDDVSLQIDKGDIYSIVGYSGAGKSTLVRVINLLQKPTVGEIKVNGDLIFQKNNETEHELTGKELRTKRRNIGMIFQHFNLLNEQTALQNVEFALKHSGLKEKEVIKKAEHLLELVGLSAQKNQFPAQLSGGQQQRVAIARALANDPEILISDEATSALDPKNTRQILDLLKSLNKKMGLTIVLITHEMEAVKRIANKVAVMGDGKIIEEGNVIDIFTNAKQSLTKELVGSLNDSSEALDLLLNYPLERDEKIYHLVYTGNAIQEPLTTRLFEKFKVETSIIYGNVDVLKNKPVGTLYVIMHGSFEAQRKASEYLRTHGVETKEVDKEE